jgi:uncharacterized protein YndB with AHSA1/START domain
MNEKFTDANHGGDREFTITRTFNAPRLMVFKAWTDPKQLAEWWGPHVFTTPVCEMDVRPGGAYRIVMRSPDGTDYPMKGFYREVVDGERLVFTNDLSEHPPEWHAMIDPHRPKDIASPDVHAVTTVTFTERDSKTTMTVRMQFATAAIRDAHVKHGMNEGWSQSFESLADYLASAADREIVISRIFNAPRQLVWQAMTDPNHVVKWWGPRGFTTTIQEMDVRPGGVWRHTMRGPDGAEYPNASIFKEIVEPERIVFSHGGRKKDGPAARFEATWTFDSIDSGAKTKVTIHMVFPSAAERDRVVREFGAIEGGKQTLERLHEHLATM